jgi:hypothetical protein
MDIEWTIPRPAQNAAMRAAPGKIFYEGYFVGYFTQGWQPNSAQA